MFYQGNLTIILLFGLGDFVALNYFLVSYDVSDPKRLREVNRLLKGFGNGIHYSVFRCDLTRKGKVELIACIAEVIDHSEDRVMIVDLGPVEGSVKERVTFLGKRPPRRERRAVIV